MTLGGIEEESDSRQIFFSRHGSFVRATTPQQSGNRIRPRKARDRIVNRIQSASDDDDDDDESG